MTTKTASNPTKPAETASQRRARQASLTRYLEREAVTLRLDLYDYVENPAVAIAEIASCLKSGIMPEEADEAACWSILREMRQAAGLSTFFLDYPVDEAGDPSTPDLRSAKGRERYKRMIVARLSGFNGGVALFEITRDCGGTVRQARKALDQLMAEGEVMLMDDNYLLVSTLDDMLATAGDERQEMRETVLNELRAMGYTITEPSKEAAG